MSDVTIAGVRISNPDKILYPEQGITKRELAEYYAFVAERMLPHAALRPITLVRCPVGRHQKCFYQRHAGAGIPGQIEKVRVPGFDNPYLFIRDVAGLVALVQIGVLEIHPWAVTLARPDRPDRLIFDLDPGEDVNFAEVAAAAHDVRDRLAGIGLESFAKTTGGKGLHVVLPIRPGHDWPAAKAWARTFSEAMAQERPDRYLISASKAERSGRIFIDYLRNDPTATAVAPFSTRARPGAPIAFPLPWTAIAPGLEPARFNVRSAREQLERHPGDPWRDIGSLAQRLPDLSQR